MFGLTSTDDFRPDPPADWPEDEDLRYGSEVEAERDMDAIKMLVRSLASMAAKLDRIDVRTLNDRDFSTLDEARGFLEMAECGVGAVLKGIA